MKRGWLFSTLILGLGMLCGCSTVALSDEARAKIDNIRVVAREGLVSYSGMLPPQYEVDNGNGLMKLPWTMPLGVAYELVTYGKTRERKTHRLKEIFKTRKVDVVGQVQEEFIQNLRDSELFTIVDEEARADANLTLTVHYGVHGATLFDESWRPWIKVEGIITDMNAKTLWKKIVELDAHHGELKEFPFPDPFQSPSNLRTNYRRGAKIIVRELLNHLAGVE